MASGHNAKRLNPCPLLGWPQLHDPKLLYAIDGVSAFHIANGKEIPLTPAGPQTLSLFMVPTTSAFEEPAPVGNLGEDFYLHLHLPPELDLSLPATTQIYHQPLRSYLILRSDLGPESDAFTRIDFPAVGSRPAILEDVDTFETILAQCTAFLERTPPPRVSRHGETVVASNKPFSSSSASTGAAKAAETAAGELLPAYKPADFEPGKDYVKGSHSSHASGQIVLVDEQNGSVVGELADGFHVVEDSALMPGSKDPVEISLPAHEGQYIKVAPASREYLEKLHPVYRKSTLVTNAAAASRLIITGSDMVARALQSQIDSFTRKTQPAAKPLTFKPATREHIRRINTFTGGAVGLSAKTVGHVSKVAQNFGATLAMRSKKNGIAKGLGPDGTPLENYKPGLLNKGLMAFSTVADGVDQAARNLLASSSSAAATVVSHKWGAEAGEVAANIGGGVKNVGLVYIDVAGVTRKAVLKSVAKGMVVGRTAGGLQVIVAGEDSGAVSTSPADAVARCETAEAKKAEQQ